MRVCAEQRLATAIELEQMDHPTPQPPEDEAEGEEHDFYDFLYEGDVAQCEEEVRLPCKSTPKVQSAIGPCAESSPPAQQAEPAMRRSRRVPPLELSSSGGVRDRSPRRRPPADDLVEKLL